MTTLTPKYDLSNLIPTSTGAVNRPFYQKLQETFSVLDFGADPTGQTDSTTAIQNAINAAAAANPVGASTTGSTGNARTILFFPAGVYVISSTLTFQPFVNYVGVRATTVDATPNAPTSSYTSSRGTILRATTSLYTNITANQGVMIYVPTGDITIENMQFVGTASINSNPSTAIQWGSSGGVATTGKTFETDGTGQNCSGVYMSGCTFYTFISAWFCNSLNDAFFYQVRFETNTTCVNFSVNTVSPKTQSAEFYGCVFYGHISGMVFGAGTVYSVNVVGGYFSSAQNNVQHIGYLNSTSGPTLTLTFTAVTFTTSGTNSFHFYMAGNYTGATNRLLASNCSFTGGGVNITQNGGSAAFTDWSFDNCNFTVDIFYITNASRGRIRGCVFYLGSIQITTSTYITMAENTFLGYSSNAISISTANCGYCSILNNVFSGNSGNIAINTDSTNATVFMQNNIGITTYPNIGIILDNVNAITYANLPASSNGSMIYCSNGTIANPVASGGTGCIAKRLNGVWVGN